IGSRASGFGRLRLSNRPRPTAATQCRPAAPARLLSRGGEAGLEVPSEVAQQGEVEVGPGADPAAFWIDRADASRRAFDYGIDQARIELRLREHAFGAARGDLRAQG